MSESSFIAKDVPSALMRQTLLDRDLVRAVDAPVRRLLPWLDVVVLGGRSICDRGGDAVLSVVNELRDAMSSRSLLVLTGTGIRARHVLGVGLDLGMPTGVLAGLAADEGEANGHLIAALLAADGASYVAHGTAAHQLSTHLAACPLVVSNGYAPFGLYELPPTRGKLPVHGADAGALLLADAYGAARVIYVKDVDGIYALDPAQGSSELLPRVSVAELAAGRPATSPLEARVPELLRNTAHLTQVQIVNGLAPGALTAALAGDEIGTILYR